MHEGHTCAKLSAFNRFVLHKYPMNAITCWYEDIKNPSCWRIFAHFQFEKKNPLTKRCHHFTSLANVEAVADLQYISAFNRLGTQGKWITWWNKTQQILHGVWRKNVFTFPKRKHHHLTKVSSLHASLANVEAVADFQFSSLAILSTQTHCFHKSINLSLNRQIWERERERRGHTESEISNQPQDRVKNTVS